MHESPVGMIVDKEVKESLFTDENTIPNENWSQYKKSIDAAEGPNPHPLDAA